MAWYCSDHIRLRSNLPHRVFRRGGIRAFTRSGYGELEFMLAYIVAGSVIAASSFASYQRDIAKHSGIKRCTTSATLATIAINAI